MEPALEVLSWCLNSVLYKEKIQLKKLHHTSYKKKLQFIQKQIAKKQFAVLAGWVFEEQRKPARIGPEYDAFPRNQSQTRHHSI